MVFAMCYVKGYWFKIHEEQLLKEMDPDACTPFHTIREPLTTPDPDTCTLSVGQCQHFSFPGALKI